jgi:hypothetical protein
MRIFNIIGEWIINTFLVMLAVPYALGLFTVFTGLLGMLVSALIGLDDTLGDSWGWNSLLGLITIIAIVLPYVYLCNKIGIDEANLTAIGLVAAAVFIYFVYSSDGACCCLPVTMIVLLGLGGGGSSGGRYEGAGSVGAAD